MIKISHECPISLLEESKVFNDYDYALVHLFESNEEAIAKPYFNYFNNAVESGRHVLLDNSLFELGEAFDPEKFLYWINKLKPTEYVIPDAWTDKDKTIGLAKEWFEKYAHKVPDSCKTIGVVQGKNYDEIVECYNFKSSHVKKIAISFGNPFYSEIFPHPNKWMALALGRIYVLTKMRDEGIINVAKPHHLLGCAIPLEFFFYRCGFEWIDTIDTSNPILHGMFGTKYEPAGILNKQEMKMADLVNTHDINEDLLKIIEHNINLFRSYVKGVNRPKIG